MKPHPTTWPVSPASLIPIDIAIETASSDIEKKGIALKSSLSLVSLFTGNDASTLEGFRGRIFQSIIQGGQTSQCVLSTSALLGEMLALIFNIFLFLFSVTWNYIKYLRLHY